VGIEKHPEITIINVEERTKNSNHVNPKAVQAARRNID